MDSWQTQLFLTILQWLLILSLKTIASSYIFLRRNFFSAIDFAINWLHANHFTFLRESPQVCPSIQARLTQRSSLSSGSPSSNNSKVLSELRNARTCRSLTTVLKYVLRTWYTESESSCKVLSSIIRFNFSILRRHELKSRD